MSTTELSFRRRSIRRWALSRAGLRRESNGKVRGGKSAKALNRAGCKIWDRRLALCEVRGHELVRSLRVSSYPRIGRSYPIFCQLSETHALTSAAGGSAGDHRQEEGRDGRSAQASASRRMPVSLASLPQLALSGHLPTPSQRREGWHPPPRPCLSPLEESRDTGRAWDLGPRSFGGFKPTPTALRRQASPPRSCVLGGLSHPYRARTPQRNMRVTGVPGRIPND